MNSEAKQIPTGTYIHALILPNITSIVSSKIIFAMTSRMLEKAIFKIDIKKAPTLNLI